MKWNIVIFVNLIVLQSGGIGDSPWASGTIVLNVANVSRIRASSNAALVVVEFTDINLVGSGNICPNPNPFRGFTRPCRQCSTAWSQVGKPCKHFYARHREMVLGTKVITVGKYPIGS